jgi:hypothetical protein
MHDDVENHIEPGSTSLGVRYWLSIVMIAACIVVVDLSTVAANYADYDTYVFYLDKLVHFPPDDWYIFEPFSNLYLLILYWVTRSVDLTIVVAHYILGAICLIFLIKSFPAKSSSWQALLFIFALLGPLLAFVTLRATPAYFLVAVGVRYALRREIKAWFYLVLAVLFHASVLLAVIPYMLLYFRSNVPKFLKTNHPVRLFVGGLALTGLVSGFVPQLSNGVVSLIESIPIFSKYIAYTSEGAAADTVTSANHYIFLAFIISLTLAFLIFSSKQTRQLNGYVLVSFVIYLGLFFIVSPVAAFRQTPFWLIPVIAYLPWRRMGVVGPISPVFVTFCVALFYFQFDQVYT